MDSQELPWQHVNETFNQKGKHLIENGLLYDCSLSVGQQPNQEIIKANKFVLAISSPVFEKMFFGSMDQTLKSMIEITDVEPDTFREFLKYLYTGEIKFTNAEFAMDIWYCGKKYMVPRFLIECSNYLVTNLQADNVCKIWEFSQFMNDCQDLSDACLLLIQRDIEIVMLSSSWIQINQKTLTVILDLDPLELTSEVRLFEGLERWMKAECERLSIDPVHCKTKMKDIIDKVMPKIRFLLMTPMEFARGPARSFLMSETEAFLLLKRISSQDPNDVIPARFSNICEKRKSFPGTIVFTMSPNSTSSPSPIVLRTSRPATLNTSELSSYKLLPKLSSYKLLKKTKKY